MCLALYLLFHDHGKHRLQVKASTGRNVQNYVSGNDGGRATKDAKRGHWGMRGHLKAAPAVLESSASQREVVISDWEPGRSELIANGHGYDCVQSCWMRGGWHPHQTRGSPLTWFLKLYSIPTSNRISGKGFQCRMRTGSGRIGRTMSDEGCEFQQVTNADNRPGNCDQRYGIAVGATVSKGRLQS